MSRNIMLNYSKYFKFLKQTFVHDSNMLPSRAQYYYQISRNLSMSPTNYEIVNLSYVSYEKTKASTKPPVFLFHGIIGSKYQWQSIGKTILNITERKVVAVDLRNHGDSPHTKSHKYLELARDVLQLIEMLDARQSILIGHNVGGRAAMCVALIAPHMISGLQVVDISPTSTPLYLRKFIPRMLLAMKTIDFPHRGAISSARAKVFKKLKGVVKDEYIMKIILANVKRQPDGMVGWACNVDTLLKDFKYWASFPSVMPGVKYKGPTLFIAGQSSQFIPRGEITSIRHLFPEAVVAQIPKAGHYVQLDNPALFLDLTLSFLQSDKETPNVTKPK